MIAHIADIIFLFIGINLTYFIFRKILVPKKNALPSALVLSTTIVFVYYESFYSSRLQNLIPNFTSRHLIYTIVAVSLSFIVYPLITTASTKKELVKAQIIVTISNFIAEMAVTTVAAYILSFKPENFKKLNLEQRLFVGILTLLGYIIAYYIAYVICKREKTEQSTKTSFAILITLFSTALLISIIGNSYLNFSAFTLIVSGISLFLIFLSMSKIAVHIRKQEQLKNKIIETKDCQAFDAEHFEDMQEKITEIRRIQHDFKDQILCIKQLMYNNSEDVSLALADSIVKSLEKDIDESKVPVFTSNVLVNTVLFLKSEEAKEKGMAIEPEISIPLTIPEIDNRDMCLLVTNLLNNAIEACETHKEDGEKKIIFKMAIKGNFFILKTINRFSNIQKDEKGKFRTTKKDIINHGIGMTIIEDLAEKYKGTSKAEIKDNLFVHTVSLQI